MAGLSSHNGEVKYAAVKALERRGDAASVDPLVNFLGQPDASAHSAAAEALGRLGDRRAVPVLVSLLSRNDLNGRLRAPVALMQIGDLSALPALREALQAPINLDDWSVRSRIEEAIKALEATQVSK